MFRGSQRLYLNCMNLWTNTNQRYYGLIWPMVKDQLLTTNLKNSLPGCIMIGKYSKLINDVNFITDYRAIWNSKIIPISVTNFSTPTCPYAVHNHKLFAKTYFNFFSQSDWSREHRSMLSLQSMAKSCHRICISIRFNYSHL